MSNNYSHNRRTGGYEDRGPNRGGGVPRTRDHNNGPRIRSMDGRRSGPTDQEINERFDYARSIQAAQNLLNNEELILSPEVLEDQQDAFENMIDKEELLRGLLNQGFDRPSNIQSMAIPQIKKGREIIAQQQSGTGKSIAFISSALDKVDEDLEQPQVIILSPTGPLTLQTYAVCMTTAKFMPKIKISCLTKGVDRNKNIRDLGGEAPGRSDNEDNKVAQIVVATPGRLKDIITEFPHLFEHIKLFIADEYDELLSGTFKDQFKEIIKNIKNRKTMQMCMFSATMNNEVMNLAKKILTNPIQILIKKEKMTLNGIKQTYIDITANGGQRKQNVLLFMLNSIPLQKFIIYVNKVDTANEIKTLLQDNTFACLCISGEMSTVDRAEVIRDFKNSEIQCLISTDLLSRGIDIQQLSLVVNYELPRKDKIECYIHRIGRTGRFGKKGLAINIVNAHERDMLNIVQTTFKCSINPLKNSDLNYVTE